jgi:hypothetical protein
MRSTMLAVGVPILTGTEKVIEAWLVAMSPEWLTALARVFNRKRGSWTLPASFRRPPLDRA